MKERSVTEQLRIIARRTEQSANQILGDVSNLYELGIYANLTALRESAMHMFSAARIASDRADEIERMERGAQHRRRALGAA
jgi:hypothetical protein